MLSTVPAAAAVRLQSVCYLALQLDYFHYLPPPLLCNGRCGRGWGGEGGGVNRLHFTMHLLQPSVLSAHPGFTIVY